MQRRFRRRSDLQAADQLAKIDVQLDKLTGLIGDLLDVTKIEAGRLQLHEEQFDFDTLVSDVVEELQYTTERHRIVQMGAARRQVWGDRERLGQVLTNLLSNAIKYSPQADRINVHSSSDERSVTLCVEDFGVGIAREKQDKVFDRFYRVSGPKQDTFPGLGLGLYLSAEIVKRQGGRIWVQSSPGKGSSFYIHLPVEKSVLSPFNHATLNDEIDEPQEKNPDRRR